MALLRPHQIGVFDGKAVGDGLATVGSVKLLEQSKRPNGIGLEQSLESGVSLFLDSCWVS